MPGWDLHNGKTGLHCSVRMQLYSVATFDDFADAQKLMERLREAGIPATIHDEARLERFWFLSKPLAAAHVEVPQPYYFQARGVIERWEKAEEILKNSVRCPQCRSSRVEYPQLTRKSILPVLIGHLLIALKIMPREYYCQDCQFTWPVVPPAEIRDHPLWPLGAKAWRSKKI
jgi:hypothetical protein